MDNGKIRLADFSLGELNEWLARNQICEADGIAGQRSFRGTQIFKWIGRGALGFDEMTNLPLGFRASLSERAVTGIPEPIGTARSIRDETVKYVMKTYDGNIVESVLMRYRHGFTACVSSQAGCRMGCAFCANKPKSFERNLSPGEMYGQVASIARNVWQQEHTPQTGNVWQQEHTPQTGNAGHKDRAPRIGNTGLQERTPQTGNTGFQERTPQTGNAGLQERTPQTGNAGHKDRAPRIGNVVVMGIGEPFDNYDNTLKFIRLLHDHDEANIGYRRITISTCGVVPGILRLADESLPIGLSVSLHSPYDSVRNRLMPVNRSFSIDKLVEACKIYTCKTNRRVTFEYALIDGINDSPSDAAELLRKVRGMLCHINLIPVNRTEHSNFLPSDKEAIRRFSDILAKGGLQATVRRELGADIMAACGQLRNSKA